MSDVDLFSIKVMHVSLSISPCNALRRVVLPDPEIPVQSVTPDTILSSGYSIAC